MKRILILFVSLSSFCSFFSMSAQTAGQQQQSHSQAFDVIHQGKLDEAILVLESAVNAPNLTAAQRGRAYLLLGYAYKEKGKFQSAQRFFDRALRVMDAAGDRSSDYASALDLYAGLPTTDLDKVRKPCMKLPTLIGSCRTTLISRESTRTPRSLRSSGRNTKKPRTRSWPPELKLNWDTSQE